MKTATPAEDLYEDFLGEIGGIGAVIQNAREKRVDGLVVVRDKPRECLFRAGSKFSNKSRFLGLEGNRAGKIAHGEVRLQFSASHLTATLRLFGISQFCVLRRSDAGFR